jgi:quinol monooxygenase YgiN
VDRVVNYIEGPPFSAIKLKGNLRMMPEENTIGVVVNGTMEIASEDRERFVALVQQNVAQTTGKPGCIYYFFASDVTNPNLFHNIEAWTNRDALDAHMKSEMMRTVFTKVKQLQVLSRDVTLFTTTGHSKL